ncbi:MAG: ABC transporter permease, partial [Actinomycetota bacterium]
GLALSLFAYGYGTLASEVERFVSEMAVIEEAIADIGGTVIDSWLAVVIMVLAVVSAVFATLSALRVRAEESTGRAEPLLATPVSRSAWLGSHLVVALAGSAMLMLGAGLGLGLGAAQALGDWAMLGRILGGALGHLPAIWVVAGAGIALFGMAPRLIPLVWVVVAYAGLVGWLGTLLRFPEWAIDLSPMGHTPLLPAEGMVWTPLAVLVAAATALVLAGMAAFRRRDLQSMA